MVVLHSNQVWGGDLGNVLLAQGVDQSYFSTYSQHRKLGRSSALERVRGNRSGGRCVQHSSLGGAELEPNVKVLRTDAS
jgi:hypothetical protein